MSEEFFKYKSFYEKYCCSCCSNAIGEHEESYNCNLCNSGICKYCRKKYCNKCIDICKTCKKRPSNKDRYCNWCASDWCLDEEEKPCDVCIKFIPYYCPLCNKTSKSFCSNKCLNEHSNNDDNIFNCEKCNSQYCGCDCDWFNNKIIEICEKCNKPQNIYFEYNKNKYCNCDEFVFYPKKHCKCVHCINNYDETLCVKCNE